MDFYPNNEDVNEDIQMNIDGMGMNEPGMTSPGMGMGGPGMGMGMGITENDILLINDIQRAVILEVQAYNYYQRLIALTPYAQEQQIIAGIQHDEMRHYHWFTMMLRMMGAQLPLFPPGELPMNFNEGVQEAIRLEIEAATFYQTIADRATAHFIRMHTLHAISDEQRHAALLNNILMSL